ncbi:pyrroline-5-carboxylate reductase dimerization domain-containing protein [Clostridium sp. WILCCON 0269]|uniref:Pyrroline-5-carboxylate reductase dimerization domain-containing protein n=1 Tax=Candidatus Clostridium eludens TaxID=3381663 RepID=A0ABW8SIY2_9CLOT
MSDYEGTANAVATKGGATKQGIICFEENNLNRIVSEAMNKAYDKMR